MRVQSPRKVSILLDQSYLYSAVTSHSTVYCIAHSEQEALSDIDKFARQLLPNWVSILQVLTKFTFSSNPQKLRHFTWDKIQRKTPFYISVEALYIICKKKKINCRSYLDGSGCFVFLFVCILIRYFIVCTILHFVLPQVKFYSCFFVQYICLFYM